MQRDILIVGASFAGLTLAHHLPKNLKVTVLEMKKTVGLQVESTGLIAEPTRQILASFTDVDRFIPNPITQICLVAPDFKKHFFSKTEQPWLHTTHTEALMKHLADTLPDNVELITGAQFLGDEETEKGLTLSYSKGGKKEALSGRFLVGADGTVSAVARSQPKLSKNTKLLAGVEKLLPGKILLGNAPEKSVYHLWFGDFSLGYGGWLSPTTHEGKSAFRVGFAMHPKHGRDIAKINELIKRLEQEGIIQVAGDPILQFSSMIPAGGPLKNIHTDSCLLIGDAAGLCGSFAADGIRGALASGIIAAELIPAYLGGDKASLSRLYPEMQARYGLMSYYKKQNRYRWMWDRMKSSDSFDALYDLVASEKEPFLKNYLGSKEEGKSLVRSLLTIKHLPGLLRYGVRVLRDQVA